MGYTRRVFMMEVLFFFFFLVVVFDVLKRSWNEFK